MYLGEQKEIKVIEYIVTLYKKLASLPIGKIYNKFRLFRNALLAFIFLYIDFFMPRQTQKGIVLLAIGVYATAILGIKVFFAVLHHIWWLCI